VARVGYGVVVRAGAPKPDLTTSDAFKRAMLQAPSIATIPESAAGAQILRVFARLGIEAEMKAKTKTVGTPPQIVQAVIQGEAALGIFLTSVFAVPGVELAGQFPGDLQQDLVYTAAPSTITRDATAAKAFMDFLKSSEAAATIRAKGMRPG
jgi:molybdate transport system substrate-binding protein